MSKLISFWYFVGTPQGQMEALCNYLALPSNLFQLFQEHKDVMSPLLQRYLMIIKNMCLFLVKCFYGTYFFS